MRSASDGFSIGSNDLTQLGTLGVDRDSEIVAFDYDERDEGVKEMIRLAVEGCRRNQIHSGCVGRPLDYPDMAEYLVDIGIDSISLNPDTVLKTTRRGARAGEAPGTWATRRRARSRADVMAHGAQRVGVPGSSKSGGTLNPSSAGTSAIESTT